MPEKFLKNRFIPYMGILNDEHMGIHNDESDYGHFFCKAWGFPISGDDGFWCLNVGYEEIFIESNLNNNIKIQHTIENGKKLEDECTYDNQGRLIVKDGRSELIIIANHFCIADVYNDVFGLPQKIIIQTTETSEINEARKWNKMVKDNPFCSHWYNLTTKVESNSERTWCTYCIPYIGYGADPWQRVEFHERGTDHKKIRKEAKEYSDFLKSGGMDNFLSKLSFWGTNYIKNIFNKL